MRIFRNILTVLTAFSILISGCKQDDSAVTGISLDKQDITLTVGETFLLTAAVTPEGTDCMITWNSRNGNIATVDGSGTVTAVSEGATSVTAAAGGFTAACKVTVVGQSIPVESVILSQESAELCIGETLQLSATVLPEDADNRTVSWSSDNTGTATVDESGLVTALSTGTAVITASAGNVSALCTITVSGASMSFTIDLSDFPDSKSYILPFIDREMSDGNGNVIQPVTGDYTLTINWGDGSDETTVSAGTDLTAAISHEYAEAVEYSITITSTAAYNVPQMPLFRLGYYHKDHSNGAKLKSMDTPMLNMGVTTYTNGFSQCINLQSVCGDLYIHNTGITIASSMFNASGLTTVPENLFAPLADVENLSGLFVNCKQFSQIPAGLLRNNTKVTALGQVFMGCSALTGIPDGLFDSNTEVNTFLNCFSNCTSLRSVPEMLFANNRKATAFTGTFMGCSNLALNSNIFCDEANEKGSRFLNQSVIFNDTFRNCGSGLEAGKGGTAPALWEYAGDNPSHNRTFQGCTAVTNAEEIDPLWL